VDVALAGLALLAVATIPPAAGKVKAVQY